MYIVYYPRLVIKVKWNVNIQHVIQYFHYTDRHVRYSIVYSYIDKYRYRIALQDMNNIDNKNDETRIANHFK